MMATMQTRTTGPRLSACTASYPRRTYKRPPQSRSSCPKNRLAGRKLAPRVFGKKAAPHARQTLLLVLVWHRENAAAPWQLVLGCVVAPNSGDAFSVGGKSAGTTTGFTQKDYNDALALLKATKPDYYNNVISKLKLSTYSGATDKTKAYSGYSNVKAGTVSVNLDSTVAAQKFSGTAAQFLAVVILHEATHVAYYQGGFRSNPGASPAMEEASIRYWVEDWAIKNGIPETVPDGRSGTGFFGNKPPFTPNFSNIYDGVVNDGYSTKPF